MLSQHPSLAFSILRNPVLLLPSPWPWPCGGQAHTEMSLQLMPATQAMSRKRQVAEGAGKPLLDEVMRQPWHQLGKKRRRGGERGKGRCGHEQGSEGSRGWVPAWAALPGDRQHPGNPARLQRGTQEWEKLRVHVSGACPSSLWHVIWCVKKKKRMFYSIRKKNFGWIVWIIKAQSSSFQGLLNLDSFTVL